MQLFSTRRPSSSAADPLLTAVQQYEQPCLEQMELTHATNSADLTTLAHSNAAVLGWQRLHCWQLRCERVHTVRRWVTTLHASSAPAVKSFSGAQHSVAHGLIT